jgi:hypothetical protein
MAGRRYEGAGSAGVAGVLGQAQENAPPLSRVEKNRALMQRQVRVKQVTDESEAKGREFVGAIGSITVVASLGDSRCPASSSRTF